MIGRKEQTHDKKICELFEKRIEKMIIAFSYIVSSQFSYLLISLKITLIRYLGG